MSHWGFFLQKSTFALGLLLALVTSGCNQNDAQAAAHAPPAEKKVEQAPVAPTAGEQPVVLTKPSYDEDAFTLSLSGPSTAQVGESVKFVVTLSAKNGFKVNEEYPVKFRPVAGAGLAFAKETVGKEDGQVEKSKVVLPIEVKLSQPGKLEVSGKLSFSVCTDDRCLIEKRDLGVTITAS